MRDVLFILILFLFVAVSAQAQEEMPGSDVPVQTVKGTIVNFKTQQPVPGATVRIAGTKLGAYSEKDGDFRIKNVPAGRQTIVIKSIGYEPYQQSLIISSGKEVQLNVELQESYVQADTVSVVAEKDNFKPINESALVSASVFSKEDVERYAGSHMDPAKMAQNYAGVLGANDFRNDIIIRGGSPTELLWRLDGLDIPNPNHFATQGATGGPISILNSTLLSNSDFLTGAFPAEYGDKMSGVFDLRTRKGNMEKYEYIGQFGINGFELGTEGPVPGVKGSFIANYRYSFLDILKAMGANFFYSGIPRYQDGTLKADLFASEKDQLSLTGIFGISNIDIKQSEVPDVATGDQDIRNGTDIMGIALNWQHLFSDNLYGKLLIGTDYTQYRIEVDSLTATDAHIVTSSYRWMDSRSSEGYHTAKYSLYYSPDKRNFITAGAEARLLYYDMYFQRYSASHETGRVWSLKQNGTSVHLLNYINWNWRITENLTSNIGVHSQYLEISDKTTIEPRASLSYRFLPLQSFNLGFGVHRQSLPLLTYFNSEGNKQLDFMQSLHYVAGYNWQMAEDALIKIEGYYKDISKVPVEKDFISSYSFINSGASFGVIDAISKDLVSTGKARSYGAEFSFIKNFSDHYYVTATASYVRQQYKGSDNIWRFGAFDNIYILNLLAGYEWVINPSFTLEFSGKQTVAGGAPYTPIDVATSQMLNGTFLIDNEAYTLRNKPYLRSDVRIDFRNNFENFSITSYVSLENVFDRDNIYMRQYSVSRKQVIEAYQMGLLFVGGVRVEF